MKATLKNARISPKKMNLVAGLVRGAKVEDALNQLKFTPKKAAHLLYKLIASAAANATNNFAQDRDKLYVKSILVGKGITYKRGIPVSRGRYHPILKRNSNVRVEIGLLEPAADTKKPAKKAEKKPAAEKKDAPKKTTAKKPAAKKAAPKKAEKKDA